MNDPGAESVATESEEVVEAFPVESPGQPPDPHSLGLELPADPQDAVHLLLTEVANGRQEASSYLDDLKRVAADFDNYRKRSLRDQAASHERAAERVVAGLLPVLDTFDAAVNLEPTTETEQKMYSGMLNTRQQLLSALQGEGLEVIPTSNEPFDPEVHEPAGAAAGNGELVVSEELRRGYRLNGKVIRAALVVLDVKE